MVATVTAKSFKESEARKFILVGTELLLTLFLHLLLKDGVELGTQVIKEQGVDDLVYVLDARVVHATAAASLGV